MICIRIDTTLRPNPIYFDADRSGCLLLATGLGELIDQGVTHFPVEVSYLEETVLLSFRIGNADLLELTKEAAMLETDRDTLDYARERFIEAANGHGFLPAEICDLRVSGLRNIAETTLYARIC
jgi:hypothetical protein